MSLDGDVAKALTEMGLTLAVADAACVGRVADRLTAVSGSSAFFVGGIEPYRNPPKVDILGVPRATLKERGAVNRPVARAMAEGVRRIFNADIGLAATGILGPTGGGPGKPVGLVFIAVVAPWGTRSRRAVFSGNRERNKNAFARASIALLRDVLAERRA